MKIENELARNEIHKSLSLCNFCTRRLAISFIDVIPSTLCEKSKVYFWYTFSAIALLLLAAAECSYVTSLLIESTSVAEFVASLHIIGYTFVAISKLFTIWHKRHVFRQLICDLANIWPVNDDDEEASIKRNSLKKLRFGQLCYMFWNLLGVSFYATTPILVFIYDTTAGNPADFGFIWQAKYPFDKTLPVYHEVTFIFEAFGGFVAVWAMLSSEILFTTMAGHISMLLRILQVKIRRLALNVTSDNQNLETIDCYEDILSVIKIHQRLISYGQDLEDAFCVVNLVNVLLSSVNICCVVFNIVILDHWMEISNKFFLGAVMTQVGILCWYADDVYRTSMGVSDAVYESGWYKSNWRCRRALLLLLRRSQRPLCFTALKFRNITLSTYSSKRFIVSLFVSTSFPTDIDNVVFLLHVIVHDVPGLLNRIFTLPAIISLLLYALLQIRFGSYLRRHDTLTHRHENLSITNHSPMKSIVFLISIRYLPIETVVSSVYSLYFNSKYISCVILMDVVCLYLYRRAEMRMPLASHSTH